MRALRRTAPGPPWPSLTPWLSSLSFRVTARQHARLSLSSNRLNDAGVAGELVPQLPRLVFLGLYGNALTDAGALLAVLARTCPALEGLAVADNPWASGAPAGLDPQAAWGRRLPQLAWVDDVYVDRRTLAITFEAPDGAPAKRARAEGLDAGSVGGGDDGDGGGGGGGDGVVVYG